MAPTDIADMVFKYGGTVILAGLFVWVFIQDKTRNTKLLEDNTKMLDQLGQSNDNIAKSLGMLSDTLNIINTKIDRNFEATVNANASKDKK